jgi:hypothetical protein
MDDLQARERPRAVYDVRNLRQPRDVIIAFHSQLQQVAFSARMHVAVFDKDQTSSRFRQPTVIFQSGL